MNWQSITLDPKQLNSLPTTPGVYIFTQKNIPIYIGKSVNLKARIKSHRQNAKLDPKEKLIWNNSTNLKFTTTDNDFMALLLEAKLISQHQPQYNVIAKDDKSYLYISINSKDAYPKPRLIRGSDLAKPTKHIKTFGPFPSKDVAEEVLNSIRRLIPFCASKRVGKRACFYSRIELCKPCPNKIDSEPNEQLKLRLQKEYRANIKQVIKILEGKTGPVIDSMTKRMDKLSERQEFEEALKIRNKLERFQLWIDTHAFSDTRAIEYNQTEKRLLSLQSLLQKYLPSITALSRIECYDASTLLFQQSTASMVVLTNGAIDKSRYRRFKIKNPRANSDFSMLKEALTRRFNNKWPKPDLIIVDGGKPQVRALITVLDHLETTIPIIGIAKGPDRIVLGKKYLPTIKPDSNHPGFNLVKLARDESHRFAKKYHTNLRSKNN